MLNLNKQELNQKVGLVLEKRKTPNPKKSEVRVFIDTSGSFKDEWEEGKVGMLGDRVLAVANRFDDNGTLDIFHFNNHVFEVGSVDFNKHEASRYLNENVLNNHSQRRNLWGGTEFAPIVSRAKENSTSKVKSGLFGFGSKEVANTKPMINYIVTDGDCSDFNLVDRMMAEMEKSNQYFMFINVEAVSEGARKLADKYSNVGYVFIPKLRSASDDLIFESLVTEEVTQWRDKFGA